MTSFIARSSRWASFELTTSYFTRHLPSTNTRSTWEIWISQNTSRFWFGIVFYYWRARKATRFISAICFYSVAEHRRIILGTHKRRCYCSNTFDIRAFGFYTLQAFVLPRLTFKIPSFTVSTESWSHLQGLQLADPNFGHSEPVNLIIGANSYGQIIKPDLIQSSSSSLVVQLTIFGWIYLGLFQILSLITKLWIVSLSLWIVSVSLSLITKLLFCRPRSSRVVNEILAPRGNTKIQ